MFRLTSLQWKSFFRSASVASGLFSKIIMFFWIIYATLMSLALGFIHGVGGSVVDPEGDRYPDPFSWINEEIFYLLGCLIIFRYIFQKIPVLNIRALLLTPLKKSRVIRYAMNQTFFSMFNLIAVFYLIPFSLFLISEPENGNFELLNIAMWNISIFALVYTTNFTNILLNKKDRLVIGIGILLASMKGLEYFEILDFSIYSKIVFNSFYETPVFVVIPLALLAYTYLSVHRFFTNNLSIDTGLNVEVKEAKMNNFNWLDSLGNMSVFLKNDLRLIMRTKRARSATIMGAFFVLYGFIFMGADEVYGDTGVFFGLLFSTGGFMMTFCGMVPSWDSKHYPLMMCQNITYLDYLKSKWYLGLIGTLLMTILASIIYSYFGLFYVVAVICSGLYNIGLNSFFTLWSGAFNRMAIDLDSNKNAFGDKKAFNSKTLILMIPQLIVPLVVYYFVSKSFDEFIAAYCVGALGLIGIFFRNIFFNIIVKTYKSQKYSALDAYKQTN